MTNLDPLEWKPAHRWKPELWTILLLIVAAGAMAGALAGYFVATALDGEARLDFLDWIKEYSEDAWPWGLTGAVFAGVIAFAIKVTSSDALK
jgi:H+/Cl- antiporter ClcA